jgi:YVTN family beta-propeller protein
MTERLRDRYELLNVLGKGGEGKVLKAVDHQHDRTVAIKVRSAATFEQRDSLLQEARTLLNLEPHRGLSVVRDDFFVDDDYYMVMDWIEGLNLQQVLEREGDPGLPYETVLGYLADVASALDHLHAQVPPVMHLDVKPANLILTDRGRVVLVDFGIASSGSARSGAGTSGYVAPELAGGEAPTPAADVYGLAATTHALLTGTPPRGKRPEWEKVPADRVDIFKRILEKALAIDPVGRPRTANEFIEQLRTTSSSGQNEDAVAPSMDVLGKAPAPGPVGGPRRRLVIAIAVLATIAAATVLFITSPWSGSGLTSIPVNSVARIQAVGGEVVDVVSVGTQPTRVAVGEGAVWVSNFRDKTVSRLNPDTGEVERVISAGGTPTDIATGEEGVWIANEFEGTVVKIDPATNTPARSADLSVGTRDIAVGEGSVWVTNVTDKTLTKLHPETLETIDSIRLPGTPEDVAVGYGYVWAADSSNKTLLRVDPSNLRHESIGLRSRPTSVAIGIGALWTASAGEDLVTRIDPDSRSTATIDVGNAPAGIAAGVESGVWVANYVDGSISHIDPRTREIVETVDTGNSPEGIAVDGDQVWVSVNSR